MNDIKELPTELANQIAAGEIVDRPASIVKELIENSIDAGADCIHIDIVCGGRALIRVSDNGYGIQASEIKKTILPHATSKIHNVNDLNGIETLGFRGEALASISSISKLTLVSRTHDATCAWLFSHKGRDNDSQHLEPIARPVGTTVEISELFFNTPARQAFLKKDKTEFAHIDELIKKFCLSYFHIEFKLTHNHKQVRHLLPASTYKHQLARVDKLCHADFLKEAVFIDEHSPYARLWGWAGSPAIAKNSTNLQYFFINGRIVKDKLITHAIKQGYRDVLHSLKQPAYILYCTLPYEEVDVNVHPTKSEVRFKYPREIHGFITGKIYNALSQALTEDKHPKSDDTNTHAYNVQSVNENDEDFFSASNTDTVENDSAYQDPAYQIQKLYESLTSSKADNPTAMTNAKKAQSDLITSYDEHTNRDEHSGAYLGQALAQVHGIFILAQNHNGLVIVDMHAAHERILYEQFKQSWSQEQQNAQNLLVPISLNLNTTQMAVVENHYALLADIGFDVTILNMNAIAIRSIPAYLKNKDIEHLFLSILAEVETYGESKEDKAYLNAILGTMACQKALKAHDTLSLEQMNELLRSAEKTQKGAYCNHGRPTWVELTLSQLDRFFMRGQ